MADTMSGRGEFDEVVEETRRYSEKEQISPEDHQRLKDAVFGDSFREVVFADVTYFVLGSYDNDEKQRLLLVRNELRRRDGAHAFLMDDMPEAWEYWTTKFRIFANRADYLVGVFEHNRGGHEWEAGRLDDERYRSKTYILKREYETKRQERLHFDGMIADYFRKLDEQLGQLYRWTSEEDLLDALERVPR